MEALELLDSGDGFVEGDGIRFTSKVFSVGCGVFALEFLEYIVVVLFIFGLHETEMPGMV